MSRTNTGRWVIGAVSVVFSCSAIAAQSPARNAMQRRQAVLAATERGVAGLPVLKAAMSDSNLLVRRAAVRGLAQIGPAAVDTLLSVAQQDQDALIRRSALRALIRTAGERTGELLAPALNDPSEVVRQDVVEQLAALQPRTPQVIALLKQAQQDKASAVSLLAANALWPFHKEAESTQERAEWRDTQLNMASTIPLPVRGWRFKLDPRGTGHEHNWFAANLTDADWNTIDIGKHWEASGHDYDGIAWYRGTVTLPAKPTAAYAGVDLVFGGVDESAWVWINGEYVGQHDEGPAGYNKTIRMEVTELLKWGEPNQIAVRVLDRANGGGIWKPISLEILKR
jgi:hypothetical protein